MRLGITIGFRHGTTTPVVITGPEVPLTEQIKSFKEIRCSGTHDEFERITLHQLEGGNARSVKFKAPAPAEPAEPAKPAESSDEETDDNGGDEGKPRRNRKPNSKKN